MDKGIKGMPLADIDLQSYTTSIKKSLRNFGMLKYYSACGRSPAEILGSNPTGGMDICLL